MTTYYRPIVQQDLVRPAGALPVAGGPGWFYHVECLRRDTKPKVVTVWDVPQDTLDAISMPRADVLGLSMSTPKIMGILNVTPDSFSDGGVHEAPSQAVRRGHEMIVNGADMIDIGGESTRPGAATVSVESEVARTEPVIRALRHASDVPISIDTRKSSVADSAIQAGANMVNDVSGFTYDRALGAYCARKGLPVCVMHAQGDPETMQFEPRYDDVLLDVYDFLAAQVIFLIGLGIPKDLIVVDPGIGFGKKLPHNLALLNRISLFHTIGCPILIGVSRKKFIGELSGVATPSERVHGSVSIALSAAAQGVQFLRVHDVRATRHGLDLFEAVRRGC